MGLQLVPNWSAIEPQLGPDSCSISVWLRPKCNPIGTPIGLKIEILELRGMITILLSSLFNTLEFDFFSKKISFDFNEVNEWWL